MAFGGAAAETRGRNEHAQKLRRPYSSAWFNSAFSKQGMTYAHATLHATVPMICEVGHTLSRGALSATRHDSKRKMPHVSNARHCATLPKNAASRLVCQRTGERGGMRDCAASHSKQRHPNRVGPKPLRHGQLCRIAQQLNTPARLAVAGLCDTGGQLLPHPGSFIYTPQARPAPARPWDMRHGQLCRTSQQLRTRRKLAERPLIPVVAAWAASPHRTALSDTLQAL